MTLEQRDEIVFRLLGMLLFDLLFEHQEGNGLILILLHDAADSKISLSLLELSQGRFNRQLVIWSSLRGVRWGLLIERVRLAFLAQAHVGVGVRAALVTHSEENLL